MSNTSILTPITSEGQAANVTVHRRDDTDYLGRPQVHIDILVIAPAGGQLELNVARKTSPFRQSDTPQTTINWPTLGMCDIDTTRAFHAALTEALAQTAALEAQRTPPAAAAATPAPAYPDHYDPAAIIRAIDTIKDDVADDPESARQLEGMRMLAMLDMPATPPRPAAAPKLTAAQRRVLHLADSKWGVWNKHASNAKRLNVAPLQVLRKLESLGLVEAINAGDSRWSVQFVATDAGRAALTGAEGGR